MDPDLLQHFNAVLRVQLMAVKQHFIHILTLKAWGDEETAQGIMRIDEVDLPNAMRIADLIVCSEAFPELCRDHGSLAEHMPAPGATYDGIFAAERCLEGKLLDALTAAKSALANVEKQMSVHLVLDPLSARNGYQQWIHHNTAKERSPNAPSHPLSDGAAYSLDALFAHLMVAIEQGLIHSFIHWHHGEKELADATWSTSGAAMMQATDITNCLALRHCAPCPANAVVPNSVQLPRVGRTPEEALLFDRGLAEKCFAAAERARVDLAGTEFEAVCQASAEYFHALSRWQASAELPEVENPCRGFERVLREFVWERDGAEHVPD